MRKMNCCYNCPKRKAHCHADCEEYKKLLEENAKRRDERGKRRATEQGIYEHVQKSVESVQRRHGRIK